MDEQVTTNTIIGRKDHDVDDEAEEADASDGAGGYDGENHVVSSRNKLIFWDAAHRVTSMDKGF